MPLYPAVFADSRPLILVQICVLTTILTTGLLIFTTRVFARRLVMLARTCAVGRLEGHSVSWELMPRAPDPYWRPLMLSAATALLSPSRR